MTSIDWSNPRASVSKYFKVYEVTQNDKRRIPYDKDIQENIIRLANNLDLIRIKWDGPIGVTSWYRPPLVNREVGGVSNSQHLYGLAADIYPIGRDGIRFEQWLDSWWPYALGYGQSSGRGFTHVDLRTNKARWMY